MKKARWVLIALALFACLAATRRIVLRAADTTPANPAEVNTLFKGMKWRLVGPMRGGRVIAVTGVRGQPNTFYFGGVSGGVWRTTDAGQRWQPLTDKEPIISIGSIAIPETDPGVIYVGTGEGCPRGNISYGNGMWKSTDNGKTWVHIGLEATQTIPKVAVNPKDANEVFVAALGHVYGSNPERGVFKSSDGGKNWKKVLYKDDKTGAVDVEFDPSNPHVLYAALWEMNRTPSHLSSGGPGSGLYKSVDDGETWKQLTEHGLPKGVWGRIGIAVSGANSDRVYALIEAPDGGLYRTDNAGEDWTRVTQDHRFSQRAWYFTHVFADPKNADTLYILNTGMYRSSDGGHSFTPLGAPHGDHHGLWIDPDNPQRMINGNDGGATVSIDGGRSWSTEENQPTAQFYHVIADNRFPYYIYGAQQDNSTVGIANMGEQGSIGLADWYDVGGGESGYIAPDPSDPEVVYAGSYGGLITRYDHRNWQEREVSPWPDNPMGSGAADLKYRFQWTFPIVISPHDPKVIYAGAQVIFKSNNEGQSWTVISPDLTRNDKTKQASSGGPITQDNTSIEYYDTVFTIAESPVKAGVIWAGADDGMVHVTRDGGKNWADVTPKEMPEWSMISLIEASPSDAGSAYLAVDRHRLDDHHPYIYKTHDYGQTWTAITAGLPDGSYVHAVREDRKRKGLLYAGTESGVAVSFDDGAHWQSLQLDLPPAPIHDLIVKDDDLVVATHGRSFWILDDVTALREYKPEIATEAFHVFAPRVAYRSQHGGFSFPGAVAGQNPPGGAVIRYVLKDALKGPDERGKGAGEAAGKDTAKPTAEAASAEDKTGKPAGGKGKGEAAKKNQIQIQILDSQGHLVRQFPPKKSADEEGPSEFPGFGRRGSGPPAEKGLNQFEWDLETEPAVSVPGTAHWGGRGSGPQVVPGHYQVKVTVAGQTATVPLEVKLDPRVKVAQADLEKQYDLGLKTRDAVNADHETVNQMHAIRAQIGDLKKRLAGDEHAKDFLDAAAALDRKMTPIEEALIQTKSKASEDPLNFPIRLDDKIAAVGGGVNSGDGAPNEQSYKLFDELNGQLQQQLTAWHEIQTKDLAALNELARKDKLNAIMLPPEPKEGNE